MAISASALFGLSAGLDVVGSIFGGRDAEEQARNEAKALAEQALREKIISEQEAEDFIKDASRTFAEGRAAAGASGIDLSTGTFLDTSADFAAEVAIQSARIKEGGRVRSGRLQQQARQTRRAGRSARRQFLFRGGASLLSGVGQSFDALRSPPSRLPTSFEV